MVRPSRRLRVRAKEEFGDAGPILSSPPVAHCAGEILPVLCRGRAAADKVGQAHLPRPARWAGLEGLWGCEVSDGAQGESARDPGLNPGRVPPPEPRVVGVRGQIQGPNPLGSAEAQVWPRLGGLGPTSGAPPIGVFPSVHRVVEELGAVACDRCFPEDRARPVESSE